YSRQAGEKATARSAHHEAVGYFEQALRALQHLPETRTTNEQAIDLRLGLFSALRAIGDYERILAYQREAESLALALDDPRRLAQVWLMLSNHFYIIGAYDQAIAAGQRALALATAGGEVVLHRANWTLGIAYQAQGDYRRAIDCYQQTVASFDRVPHRERVGDFFQIAASSRARLAWCHAELGRFVEGRVIGEEGLRLAESAAPPWSLMLASWGIGLLCLRQGDLSKALPLLERAVRICQEADLWGLFPRMAAALGTAYTLGGRVADALPLLTQAREHHTTTGRAHYEALCCLPLGEAYLRASRLEEAYACAERTLMLTRQHQERDYQAYALRLLANIAARRESSESALAETHYHQALALAEELGMRPLQAHCHRGLGTLYAMTGQWEQARTALSTTIEMYRDMDMTFWLPQTEAALAQEEGRQ